MSNKKRPGELAFEESPFYLEDARTIWDRDLFQGVCGALTRCPNGDFLTAFMKRTDAMVDNATYFLRSRDNGVTWEKEDLIIRTEREEGSLHVAQGMMTTKSGKILLPFDDVSSGRLSLHDHPRYMKLRLRHSDLKMMVSEDSGKSWSERYNIDPEKKWGPANYPYGKILELEGELILPMCGPKGRSTLLRSRDEGASWGEQSVIAEHSLVSFEETSMSLCSDGSLVALLRTPPTCGGFLWQARSHDRGRTWEEVRPSGLLGQCMCVHTLPSGRVVAAYRKAERLWDDDRAGLGLSWSDDNGENWQGELTLKDPKGYEYRYVHETGMPAIEDLGDNQFLVLFYSFDPDLPFDYTTEKDPEPWKDCWYWWKRYIACNVLKER